MHSTRSTTARGGRSLARRPSRLTRSALAGALLLGVTSLTAPLAAAQGGTLPPAIQPGIPTGEWMPRATTVDRITDNPGNFYGLDVTLLGDVDEVLGPRSFTIEDQDLLFDEELLVVSARPFAAQPNRAGEAADLGSETLMIRGSVHQFNEAAFEQRLGIDLDDERVAAWAGRPAIIAERLSTWSPAMSGPWPGGRAAGSQPPTTLDEIADNPTAHARDAVTTGGYIAEVISERVFVIEDRDLIAPEQVLVVTDRPASGLPGLDTRSVLDADRYVWVSGTVHQFNPAAFAERTGTVLDDPRLEDWAGRSAILAGSVVPVRWGTERRPPMAASGTAVPTPGAQTVHTSGTPTPSRVAGTGREGTAAQGGKIGIDTILDAPGSYVGETVTVSGEVGEMVGPRSFLLTDAGPSGEPLLVVSALSLPATFSGGDDGTPDSGQPVDVTGEVWRFDLEEIEARIGLDLDDSRFTDWIDQPVMVATAVSPEAR